MTLETLITRISLESAIAPINNLYNLRNSKKSITALAKTVISLETLTAHSVTKTLIPLESLLNLAKTFISLAEQLH